MRSLTVSATLILALLLAGCGSDSATSPSAPTSAGPSAPTSTASTAVCPPPPGPMELSAYDLWNLTETLTAITGTGVCWAPYASIGTPVDILMGVQRSGTCVSLIDNVHNYPTDHTQYVGTVLGEEFTASSSSGYGFFPCGGTRVDYQFDAQVSGRFSADGRALTAKAIWSYRLTSGEEVRFYFDWTATQQ